MTIVVDVGASRIRGGLSADPQPAIDIPSADNADEMIGQIVETIEICQQHSDSPVIVGVPGLVTIDGNVTHALYSALKHRPLRSLIEARTGHTVQVLNDASLHALGAAHILGNPSAHLHLSLGTGVGGAITEFGRLWRGANGFAGEVGHIPVRRNVGRCPCGLVDCLDLVVAGHRLEEELGGTWWSSAASHDDRLSLAGHDVGEALVAAHSLLDLAIASVAGHLSRYSAFRTGIVRAVTSAPQEPLIEILAESLWDLARRGADRVVSQLDDPSGR